jgi:putative oxidoreductase
MINQIKSLYDKGVAAAERVPYGLTALLVRIGVFGVFWASAMTKIIFDKSPADHLLAQIPAVLSFGWSISANAFYLFEHEYQVPLLPPILAAYLATAAELTFSLSVLLGLFTRLSALVLLGMTLVIQIFVYPELWLVHALWMGALLLLVSRGGGGLAIDRLLQRFFIRFGAGKCPA